MLPDTVRELQRLSLRPQIVCLDGGFQTNATEHTLKPVPPRRIHIAGRSNHGARATRRRLTAFRTGSEGRISHLKRGYGLRRSKLRGLAGANTDRNWSILAYDLDTYLRYAD